MALAPAALAELVDVAALLFVLLGWVVSLGLLWTWRHTIGLAFLHLADALNFSFRIPIVGRIGFDWGGPFRDFSTLVENWLSAWALGSDILAGKLFYGLTWIFQEMAHASSALAQDVFDLGHWIVRTAVPAYVHAQLWPIREALRAAHAVTKVIQTRIVHVTKVVEIKTAGAVHTVIRETALPFLGSWRWLHAHIAILRRLVADAGKIEAAIAIPFPTDLPIPWGRTISNIRKRLGKVEALLGASAFAVAMANVLGLPNWRCLTRGNVGRTARALCGLSPAALQDILGLLTDVLLVTNICMVTELLEQGLQLVEGPIDSIVGVVGGSLCNGDFQKPPSIGPVALSLPPVSGLALSGV